MHSVLTAVAYTNNIQGKAAVAQTAVELRLDQHSPGSDYSIGKLSGDITVMHMVSHCFTQQSLCTEGYCFDTATEWDRKAQDKIKDYIN